MIFSLSLNILAAAAIRGEMLFGLLAGHASGSDVTQLADIGHTDSASGTLIDADSALSALATTVLEKSQSGRVHDEFKAVLSKILPEFDSCFFDFDTGLNDHLPMPLVQGSLERQTDEVQACRSQTNAAEGSIASAHDFGAVSLLVVCGAICFLLHAHACLGAVSEGMHTRSRRRLCFLLLLSRIQAVASVSAFDCTNHPNPMQIVKKTGDYSLIELDISTGVYSDVHTVQLDTAVDAGGANPSFANAFFINPIDDIAYGKFTDGNNQDFFCRFAANQIAEPMECLCALSIVGKGGTRSGGELNSA
ncbi:hypothetical protein EMIHUDRAFT_438875, partial [Emiliania huxleyi CCMP1516]|uniref:C2 domain-containing protein n=4 Tax=Emiliania huxleyi TaxID=2903 RepID=A0A0D3I3B0_EMIH1